MNYGDIKPLSGVALEIHVNGVVALNLDKMAQARGLTRALFVQQLFDAAYSARCAPTGDDDLDAAVTGEQSGGDTKASGKIRSLQQSNAALREQIAAMKNAAPVAGASGEVLELRRKLLEAEQTRAANERALQAKIEALDAQMTTATREHAEALASLKGKIGGLTAENSRLRQAARVASDIGAVKAEIVEVGKALASAEAEIAAAPPPAPEPPPQDFMTRHNIKTAKGYSAAGWDVPSIATEMGLTVVDVRALLGAKVK